MEKSGITLLGRDPVMDYDITEFSELCEKRNIYVDSRVDLSEKPLYKWRLKLVLKMVEDTPKDFKLDQDTLDNFMHWLVS